LAIWIMVLAITLRLYGQNTPAHTTIPVNNFPSAKSYIPRWKVLGPFPNPIDKKNPWRTKGFSIDYLKTCGGEDIFDGDLCENFSYVSGRGATIIPDTFTVVANEAGKTGRIDFSHTPVFGEHRTVYAFCYVNSPRRDTLFAALGSDDNIKVFVNGSAVFKSDKNRPCRNWNNTFPIIVDKGLNFFNVKLLNATMGWEFILELFSKEDFTRILSDTLFDLSINISQDSASSDTGYFSGSIDTRPSSSTIGSTIQLTTLLHNNTVLFDSLVKAGDSLHLKFSCPDNEIISWHAQKPNPKDALFRHRLAYTGNLSQSLRDMKSLADSLWYKTKKMTADTGYFTKAALTWISHQVIHLLEKPQINDHGDMAYTDAVTAYTYMKELTGQLSKNLPPLNLVRGHSFPQIFLPAAAKEDKSLVTSYLLYVPKDYSPKNQYPVILFLHGANYRVNINLLLEYYRDAFTYFENKRNFPFIIIAPKCIPGQGWDKDPRILKELLDTLAPIFHFDSTRLYATGFSMGAFRCFDLASQYPDFFAAIAPFAGSTAPSSLRAIAHIPLRLSIGRKDETIPLYNQRRIFDELTGMGASPHLVVYDDLGHKPLRDFSNPDLYRWLLKNQNRSFKRNRPVPEPAYDTSRFSLTNPAMKTITYEKLLFTPLSVRPRHLLVNIKNQTQKMERLDSYYEENFTSTGYIQLLFDDPLLSRDTAQVKLAIPFAGTAKDHSELNTMETRSQIFYSRTYQGKAKYWFEGYREFREEVRKKALRTVPGERIILKTPWYPWLSPESLIEMEFWQKLKSKSVK